MWRRRQKRRTLLVPGRGDSILLVEDDPGGAKVEEGLREKRWFWATLILSSVSITAIVFGVWELVESRFFRQADYLTLHYLYITRGIASSLLLAMWASWYVLHEREKTEAELRRSRERYRGLLEVSPGAVALYDETLHVSEWNETAERLYGLTKNEVIGHMLPTVPCEKQAELTEFLRQVKAGRLILDVETLRRDKSGKAFEVQLSLLPFQESPAQRYFLEVTSDIRERVQMRTRLLEIEKLTSMGKMAAGTAHHLNTPLAAMLLRVQMMRERLHNDSCSADLEKLEAGLRFCQQFVQRLLEFSRRPAAQKQPEKVAALMHSVISFLAPSIQARRAQVVLELDSAEGEQVLADRNQLEALFCVLLSNALDAIAPGGTITIQGCCLSPEELELRIADDGCGISGTDFAHVFEPFFTTKESGRGTGLGLAIAQNIVKEHGGKILLESKPGQGTVACMRFPVICRPPGGTGD